MKRVKTDAHYKWESNRKGDSHVLCHIYTLRFLTEAGVEALLEPREVKRNVATVVQLPGWGNANTWVVRVNQPLMRPGDRYNSSPYAVNEIIGLKEAKAWAEVMVRMQSS